MSRVVHFEIPCDDLNRAEKFYTETFGWKITKWDGPTEYRLADTGDAPMGINGGLLKRHPGMTTTNTIGVESLDASVEKVLAAGGRMAMEKMAVPGIGWLAYCFDTEGNMFGMLQPDMEAK